jgi:hypothetical protein
MIITGYIEYAQLKERMNRELHIYVPVFRDIHYHRTENTVLCFSVMFSTGEVFVVSVTHEDAPHFPIYTTPLSRCDIHAQSVLYERGKEIPSIEKFYSLYVQQTHSAFYNLIDINRIIPLTVWADILARYSYQLLPELNVSPTYTESVITVLQQIEDNGLYVDREKLQASFGKKALRSFKDSMVYSQYNAFTATGRPSNRFGGINFSALNKSDDTRDTFVSRFPNGILVQMDFEAYHLRLIANHLGVSLPNTSLHMELAKIYFGTDNITDEMYEESKRKTFNLMYGMIDNSYSIDLFNKIYKFRMQFEHTDTVKLPSGVSVSIDNPNHSKLFNYYMQSLEVVTTIPKLLDILDYTRTSSAKLILYTYDSILLDMEAWDDGLVRSIKSILEEGNFPVRVYMGDTYKTLRKVNV